MTDAASKSIQASSVVRGALCLTLAAALFPVKDGFIKALSGEVHSLLASSIYFLIQGLVALALISLSVFPNQVAEARNYLPTLCFRAILLVSSISLFFAAVQVAPLAEAVVVFTSQAIFVVLFSAILLQEKLTFSKLSSSLIGFLGVLVILRPTPERWINAGLAYALFSAIFFALYLIFTRRIGRVLKPGTILLFDGFIGALLSMLLCASLSMFLPASDIVTFSPSYRSMVFLAFSGIVGAASSLLVIYAFRVAPASVIAPFSYFEIVSAAFIGYLVFLEPLHITTAIGTVLVVIASWLASRSSSSEKSGDI